MPKVWLVWLHWLAGWLAWPGWLRWAAWAGLGLWVAWLGQGGPRSSHEHDPASHRHDPTTLASAKLEHQPQPSQAPSWFFFIFAELSP